MGDKAVSVAEEPGERYLPGGVELGRPGPQVRGVTSETQS